MEPLRYGKYRAEGGVEDVMGRTKLKRDKSKTIPATPDDREKPEKKK